MVATSVTLLATISTIIVVTMATLFFCCWHKKQSQDIGDGKISKKQKPEEENSATPVLGDGKSENGVVSDSLSSPTFVVSNEELGDFSAVQRETEILRSYRKPPPPKNRARQSRAPRALKSSTENLDIFTELNEEDKRLSEANVKSDDTDEVDTSLLRPRSQVNEGTREARSSMLADIEQTLAALHMSDDAIENSKESSPARDPVSPKESDTVEPPPKPQEDKVTISKDTETETDKFIDQTEKSEPVKVAKTYELKVEQEYKPESHSPQSSPKPKHKRGPQVSPKPNIKLMGKFSGEQNVVSTADKDIAAPKQAGDSSLSVTKSENNSSFFTAASSFPSVSESASEIKKTGAEILNQTSLSDSTSGVKQELSALSQDFVSEKKQELSALSQDFVSEKKQELSALSQDFVSEKKQELSALSQELVSEKKQLSQLNQNVTSEKNDRTSRIEEIKDQLSSQATAIPSTVLNEKNSNTADEGVVKSTATVLLQSATNGNNKITEHIKSVAENVNGENKTGSLENSNSHNIKEQSDPQESPKSVSKLITTNGHDVKATGPEKVSPVRDVSAPDKSKDTDSPLSETGSNEQEKKGPPLASPERDVEVPHQGISPDKGQEGAGQEKTEGHEKQRHGSAEDPHGKGKGSRIPVRAGSKPRSSPPKNLGSEKTAEAK